VEDLMERMAAAGGAPAVVLDANNRLAGIVTAANVDRTIQVNRVRASRR
jgi:CBS domain-containing protein